MREEASMDVRNRVITEAKFLNFLRGVHLGGPDSAGAFTFHMTPTIVHVVLSEYVTAN